jgi:hypothetical protein
MLSFDDDTADWGRNWRAKIHPIMATRTIAPKVTMREYDKGVFMH